MNDQAPPRDDWIIRLGEIGVSRNFIATPESVTALKGTTFSIVDRTAFVSRTPTWAIVVAVVGFFVVFVLSLLFLLVKESAPTGTLEVRVDNPATGLEHVTVLPVRSSGDIADAYARVSAAQQLAAAA